MTTNDHEAGKVSDDHLSELIDFADKTGAEDIWVPVSIITELRTRRAESQTSAVRVKALAFDRSDEAGKVSAERLDELITGFSIWGKTNSARPQIDLDVASALTELRTRRAEAAEGKLAEAVKAMRRIKPYLDFTVGAESVGYHPTMPSAVEQFSAALSSLTTPPTEQGET